MNSRPNHKCATTLAVFLIRQSLEKDLACEPWYALERKCAPIPNERSLARLGMTLIEIL